MEQLISIHAPTRGATIRQYGIDGFSLEFQSTLPREERRMTSDETGMVAIFQSTLPREERLQSSRQSPVLDNFNPRSHERSDSNIAQKICLFLYNTDNKYIIR